MCSPARFGKRLVLQHLARTLSAGLIDVYVDACPDEQVDRWIVEQLAYHFRLSAHEFSTFSPLLKRAKQEIGARRYLIAIGGLDLDDERLAHPRRGATRHLPVH